MLMKSSTQSLTEQLSERFAERIRNRLLAPGARLPSVRQCAQQNGVSPSTVVAAYDQLLALGLVEARKNRGFFVRDGGVADIAAGAGPRAADKPLAHPAPNPVTAHQFPAPAAGRAAVCCELRTSPWDHAAGFALVHAAGGTIYMIDAHGPPTAGVSQTTAYIAAGPGFRLEGSSLENLLTVGHKEQGHDG